MVELLSLVVVGLVAGVVNTLAGGGSFLTLAALMWLGMPPQLANGTNRVGVLLQSLTAAGTYRRAGLLRGDAALGGEIAVTSLGALGGAGLATVLSAQAFEAVLVVAMLAVVGLSLGRPKAWNERGTASSMRWPALFAAGWYGGFLQAGVGVLLLPVLVVLGGHGAVGANARKVALVVVLTAPALLVFGLAGQVAPAPAAALALGGLLGGGLGARLSIAGGARWIRRAVAVVVVLTVVRLLVQ